LTPRPFRPFWLLRLPWPDGSTLPGSTTSAAVTVGVFLSVMVISSNPDPAPAMFVT
jgi:hypothetical protein